MTLPSVCLLATVKNEGPWLLEWVAHHRAIGFDPIIVASNDCDDGTDLMLERLQEMGEVIHVPNPPPYESSVQETAYARARALPALQAADWVMVLDADEFLNVHVGNRSVHSLISSLSDKTEAVVVTWRNFGDAERVLWEDGEVCAQFTRAQDQPNRHSGFKVLFRDQHLYDRLWVHGPWSDEGSDGKQDAVIRTAAGKWIRRSLFRTARPKSTLHANKQSWVGAQINHYAVKTRDVFGLKRYRGRGGKLQGIRHNGNFFNNMNSNKTEDLSIQETEEARREKLASYRADEMLDALHQSACKELVRKLRHHGFWPKQSG